MCRITEANRDDLTSNPALTLYLSSFFPFRTASKSLVLSSTVFSSLSFSVLFTFRNRLLSNECLLFRAASERLVAARVAGLNLGDYLPRTIDGPASIDVRVLWASGAE